MGPSGPQNSQFSFGLAIQPQKTVPITPKQQSDSYRITIKSFSIHPICITHLTQLPSALLACPHNSLYSFQNILKLRLQLVENLDLRLTKAKHLATLTECGCCGEGENECIIKIELNLA